MTTFWFAFLSLPFFLTGSILAASSEGKALFSDQCEGIVTNASVISTRAERFIAPNKETGEIITGQVAVVDGKSGKALQLKGLSQVRYAPATGNVDLTGGELSFWVKLHFDPMESNERNRGPLSNQMFLSIWDLSHGHSKMSVYNAGHDVLAACVQNAEGNVVFYTNFRQAWKPGEWHQLTVKWGKEMEFWCDGEKKASGLSMVFDRCCDLDQTRILVGPTSAGPRGKRVHIDELIMVPRPPDQPAPPLCAACSTRNRFDGKLNDPFWGQGRPRHRLWVSIEHPRRQSTVLAPLTRARFICARSCVADGHCAARHPD